MWLRKAYLSFHRRANARVLSHGITADQFVVLSVVAGEPGMTQIAIVERTASDENTVAAILRRLERQRLVRREAHANDGRARCVFLTAAGGRVQRRAAKAVDPVLAALWGSMTDTGRLASERCLKDVHELFFQPRARGNGQPRIHLPKRKATT
jgi:MarR family transcriptional regulator, organic hydroperoxide resistance regulator